jgi:hypothetical protein
MRNGAWRGGGGNILLISYITTVSLITTDSHTTGYPLVNLQQEDSQGITIRNDMREMNKSQ